MDGWVTRHIKVRLVSLGKKKETLEGGDGRVEGFPFVEVLNLTKEDLGKGVDVSVYMSRYLLYIL